MTTHDDRCIEARLSNVGQCEGLSIEGDTNDQLARVSTFTNPVIEGVLDILAGIPEVWGKEMFG